MKTLNHPNIVKLHEALEDENTSNIYLVMEYCSRGSLLSEEFWKGQQPKNLNALLEIGSGSPTSENTSPKTLPLDQAKDYFIQIVLGLDYSTLL
jgi:serine/threonine protein kinase